MPYLRLHYLANTVGSIVGIPEALPNPAYGLPNLSTVAFPYEWLVSAQASYLANPLKQATADLSEPPNPVPLAKWPQAWH